MGKFWDMWGSLFQRLVASVGSQASLIALVLVFAPQPVELKGWPLLLIILAAALAVTSIWLEIRAEAKAHKHRKSYQKTDSAGIKSYMRRWIANSGRAAIWTRDLSWADDMETINLLKTKASGGNLIVCMPKMNAIAQELSDAGADLRIYGTQGFDSPASRFTIAYSGNGGSQVAIGKADGGVHVIEEIDSGDPALHMATDLVALAKLLAQQKVS